METFGFWGTFLVLLTLRKYDTITFKVIFLSSNQFWNMLKHEDHLGISGILALLYRPFFAF